jgi:hypothetical protein
MGDEPEAEAPPAEGGEAEAPAAAEEASEGKQPKPEDFPGPEPRSQFFAKPPHLVPTPTPPLFWPTLTLVLAPSKLLLTMQFLDLSQNQRRRKRHQPKPMQATTVQPLEAKRLLPRRLVREAAVAMVAAPRERRGARSQAVRPQAGKHPLPMLKVNDTTTPSFLLPQCELVRPGPF